jgi:hypothetical protein
MRHPREAIILLWKAFWSSWTAILVVACGLLIAFGLAVNMVGYTTAKICFIAANIILLRKLSICDELHGAVGERKPNVTRGFIIAILFVGFGLVSYWEWGLVSRQQVAFAEKVPSGPLTEAQEAMILSTLSQYPRHKVLILFGVGSETAAYANQFSYLFQKAKWIVEGPRPARTDRVVLDLQISMDPSIYTHPEVGGIISSFVSAGIPHRSDGVHDPNVPSDWIVLWVGAPEGGPTFIPLQVLPGTFNGLN